MKKVLVKIFDTKYIPGVGKGPFIDPPVAISQSTLRNLSLAGIKLFVVDKKDLEKANKENETPITINTNENDVTSDDNTVSEEVDSNVENTEETEVEVDEDVEVETETEDTTEEVVEDETNYNALTIKELKTMLDEAGVDYPNNALKKELIDLVKKI